VIFPNSSAMDATASSGGPITVLPQIFTGSPEQIAQHVAELVKKAAECQSIYTEFTKAAGQLEKTWSGAASESALKKISDSLSSLTKIISVVEKGAELLGISGTLVKTAQEAYRAIVSAVNPTVAALMSNWWTYGAAVALSTATSASLRAFIEAIGALLKALGVVDLANQISQLATIITEIEKLFGASSATTPGTAPTGTTPTGTTPGAATPTNTTVSGTPVAAPQTPPPVASPAGQQTVNGPTPGAPGTQPGFTGYTPPALAGYGNGTTPSTDSWIPVTPAPPVASVPTPVTPVPAASNGHIVVDFDPSTGETKVDAPAGTPVNLDISGTYGGKPIDEHLHLNGAQTGAAT
jgi:uncharacterized protein YukE